MNNLISVKSGLSVGSYDLGKISGVVTLRKAIQGEGYTGIGKDFLDMENMLVLADDEGIFGSSMSDSVRAMVTESTTCLHGILLAITWLLLVGTAIGNFNQISMVVKNIRYNDDQGDISGSMIQRENW